VCGVMVVQLLEVDLAIGSSEVQVPDLDRRYSLLQIRILLFLSQSDFET